MAKKTYIGVDNKAHKVKKMYIGINDTSRKIKKAYIGVNNIAQQCFSGDIEFTYSGRYKIVGDLGGKWELALLSSGTLSFSSLNTDKIDVWAISAGGNGKRGSYDYDTQMDEGGAGGDGGRVKFATGISIKEGDEKSITIGLPSDSQGKSGGDTIGLGITTANGAFKPGATNPGRDGNRDGQQGVIAFNGDDSLNFPGRRFGASGAAGGSYDQANFFNYPPGTGGTTGGGDGGSAYFGGVSGGTNATADTGSGGGNGGIGDGGKEFGKGSNGVMLIRPHFA